MFIRKPAEFSGRLPFSMTPAMPPSAEITLGKPGSIGDGNLSLSRRDLVRGLYPTNRSRHEAPQIIPQSLKPFVRHACQSSGTLLSLLTLCPLCSRAHGEDRLSVHVHRPPVRMVIHWRRLWRCSLSECTRRKRQHHERSNDRFHDPTSCVIFLTLFNITTSAKKKDPLQLDKRL